MFCNYLTMIRVILWSSARQACEEQCCNRRCMKMVRALAHLSIRRLLSCESFSLSPILLDLLTKRCTNVTIYLHVLCIFCRPNKRRVILSNWTQMAMDMDELETFKCAVETPQRRFKHTSICCFCAFIRCFVIQNNTLLQSVCIY